MTKRFIYQNVHKKLLQKLNHKRVGLAGRAARMEARETHTEFLFESVNLGQYLEDKGYMGEEY
jgi:hypothetical protein